MPFSSEEVVKVQLDDDSVGEGSVIAWTPERELAERAVLDDASAGTLLLLPDKFSESGKARYRDDIAGLAKTAQANSVDLVYSFSKDERELLSEYSVGLILVGIGLGVVGNLTTDGVKKIAHVVRLRVQSALRRRSEEVEGTKVQLRIAEYSVEPDRKIVRGLEYIGPAAGVEKALLTTLEGPEGHEEAKGSLERGTPDADE